MELPDSALVGPMGPLIRQLHRTGKESSLPSEITAHLGDLKEKLEELYASIKYLVEAENSSNTAMFWLKEIRDLCHETKDNLDKAVASNKIPWKSDELMARVRAVSERGTSLQLTDCFIQAPTPDKVVKLDLPVPCAPIEDLLPLLAFGDEKAKQLRVVTLFGFAGAINTIVARTLFDTYGGRFHYRAFVRPSLCPDMRSLLMSILKQIKAPPPKNGFSDVSHLTRSIMDHLQYKRYLIVIDDLWTTPGWNYIIDTFPCGYSHSRIITTTQVKHVALASCDFNLRNMFPLTPLNDEQSDITVEGMKQNLNLIYNKLPPYMKTYLLYYNMYPAGCTIRKDELVKQWVAEGFLEMTKLHLREAVAGLHFDDLVRKGLIQAVDTNCKDEVMSCTVQQMVLDMITNKCKDLDFITSVNNEFVTAGHPVPRRLSIHFRYGAYAYIPQDIVLTKVRSLSFSGFYGCVPSLVECSLLQVLILNIWADQDEATFDLSRISDLLLLRYVKIACNIDVELPPNTGELKYLETLAVDARVAHVPANVTGLPCLYHLILPSANLPDGVTGMTSLRTLGCFDLSINSQENVKKLFELENIEDLHLICSAQPDNMQEKMDSIWSSILSPVPHSSLRSVYLMPAANYEASLEDAFLCHINCTPSNAGSDLASESLLERLQLSPRICIFFSIPQKFAELSKLCILKIALREISENDIDILKGLPALAALSLYVWTNPEERVAFSKDGFPVLTFFKFTCTSPCLAFQEEAMPRVQRLKLRFNASRLRKYSLLQAGFENLPKLKVISVKVGSDIADYESERMDTECAIDLESTFKKHPYNSSERMDTPIVNVRAVDRIFGADRLEQADSRSASSESSQHQKSIGEEQTDDVHNPEALGIIKYVTDSKNFEFIQRQMEQMTIIIEQNKEENEGPIQERWVLKLQELVYDIEDFKYKLSLLTTAALFFSREIMMVKFLKRMKDLIRRIKILRDWQNEAAQWSLGGGSIVIAASTSAPFRYQPPACYTPEYDLVGMDEPQRELMELMSLNGAHNRTYGDVQLRVISIEGCSGLGKSTLARSVYNNVGFYKVWVVASDCNSAGDLLNKILQQVAPQDASDTTRKDDLLSKTLDGKRYLFVIDQVQRAEVWYGIQYAFPNYNNGSRIVLTTSIKSVAAAATTTNRSTRSYVYTMRGLGNHDSRRLFWKQFYGCDDTESAPVLGNDCSESVFKKCDGLPLSLLSMARYLRQQHRTVGIERFGSHIEVTLEAMNNTLAQCYNSLPDNAHRTCVLSLGTFPQGYPIKRKSLIRRWVAEGLVVGIGSRSGEEVAAGCYDELIDRNIIKPVLVSNNSTVKRCRPHGLMLEFIVNKGISRNFLTLIRKDEAVPNKQDPLMRRLSISEDHLVRRLSVHDGTAESARVATEIGLSVVRSLTIFKSLVLDFRSCKLLRILDLEGCKGIDSAILGVMCQLEILKYLSLRGSDVRRIPKRIRRLQYLETLDLRETDVEKLPIEVIRLPWLAHLFGQFELPRQLKQGKKKDKVRKFLSEKSRLQTLSGFVMDKTSGSEFIMLQARYLRKVKIWCNRFSTVLTEDQLVSSLNRHFTGSSALESLSIDLNNHSPDFLHSLQAPCFLSSIKLIGRLGKLPNFIASPDTKLREVQLSSTGLGCQELSLLQKLPYLLYLKLYEEDQRGFRGGVFEVDSGGFPVLERLCIQASSIPNLHIKQGAMNKLTSLHLLCPEYAPSSIEGIEHLQHLNEVVLHDSREASEMAVWKKMAMEHENRPRVAKQATSS